MATMAENIIATGYKTRPPMLKKGMYDSWKTQIMLYIRRKENGEMLRDSVENDPYKFKSEHTAKHTYGITSICRAERLEDLKGDDKLSYDSDIKAVNILLLRLLVDIYTLINHYQTAKEIWDRIKELMEGTEMTKQEPIANFIADHVDEYDLDCDDEATTDAIFMANLSHVGSLNDDMIAPRYDSDTLSESYDELKGNSDVISYIDYMINIRDDADNYVPPPV
ncbi:hypothetical protein Tco_0484903 [Tanacetum coccineum]